MNAISTGLFQYIELDDGTIIKATPAMIYAVQHGVSIDVAEAEVERQHQEGMAFLRSVMGDDFDKLIGAAKVQ